ncbi:MAG: hypothetical protein ACK4UJ_11525 [Leptonema sp. (in: bacteria)]
MFPTQQIKGILIDILAKSFTAESIDNLGKDLFQKFNVHLLSGQPFGTMLSSDVAARTIVEYSIQQNKIKELTELIIQIGFGNKFGIQLKEIEMSNLNELLKILSSFGFHYMKSKGALEFTNESDNWGYLEENREYYFSYMSIDIVGNSQIQLKYEKNLIEEVYTRLHKLIKIVIELYEGKIWNWAGDGGIAAFFLNKVEEDAVLAGIKIFHELFLFNLNPERNKFDEPIKLRIGIHSGKSIYKENKGMILSDAINFVAHLEKNFTETNHISISKDIYEKLNSRIQSLFYSKGVFEGKECYTASFDFKTVVNL